MKILQIRTGQLLMGLVGMLWAGSVGAQTEYIWTGESDVNSLWTTAENWNSGNVPPATPDLEANEQGLVVFNNAVRTDPNVNQAWTLDGLRFDAENIEGGIPGAGSYTITGSTLTFAPVGVQSTIYNYSLGAQTIENDLVLTGNLFVRNWTEASGTTLRLNGDIDLNGQTLTVRGADGSTSDNNRDVQLHGVISGHGTVGNSPAWAAWGMHGDNTYTGETIISRGHSYFSGNGVFGDSLIKLGSASGKVLHAVGGALTIANDWVWNSVHNNHALTFASSAWTLNGTITLGDGLYAVRSNNFNVPVTINGAIGQEAGGDAARIFNLRGASVLTLTEHNTYTMPTDLGGTLTLVVNGSIAASASLTVNDGTTLKGTGIVPGTTVKSGGILYPGNSIGTLTAADDVVLESGAIFRIDIGTTAGESSQLVVDGGKLDLSSAGAILRLYSAGALSGQYTIATFTDQGASDYGIFSAVYLNDAAVDLQTWDYELAYNSDSIQLIPEPSAWIMLLLGGATLLLKRKR